MRGTQRIQKKTKIMLGCLFISCGVIWLKALERAAPKIRSPIEIMLEVKLANNWLSAKAFV
jgi:hypothetical protein